MMPERHAVNCPVQVCSNAGNVGQNGIPIADCQEAASPRGNRVDAHGSGELTGKSDSDP